MADKSDAKAAGSTFTVAAGRKIIHDGKPFAAGQEIVLPEDEGKRLQELGFLVGDDGNVVIQTEGPAVVQGTEIKES